MSYDIDELMQRMGKPGSTGRHATNEDRDKVYTELHDRGYSYRQIALVFDVSAQSVFAAIKRYRESHLT